MNKIELNKYIESISSQIPLIHSFYTDDVYEVWNSEEVRYGSLSFCITSSSVNDSTTVWNATVYYADRLLEDKSNRDAIQTDSINIITSIMNAVAMDEDIVSINYPTQIELFEQRFADYLSGGYAVMQIETQNSVSKCNFGYVKEAGGCEGAIHELESEIRDLNNVISEKDEVIDNLESQIDEFGVQCESEKQQIISEKDEVIADKELEINELNTTIEELRKGGIDFSSIGYDKEESALANNDFNNSLQRSKELLESWEQWKYVQFDYETAGYKDIIYAPMFTFEKYKDETNIRELFGDCKKLQYIPSYDFSAVYDMYGLFRNCRSLTYIPYIDTSNVTDMQYLFYMCDSLAHVPTLITSNVTNMYFIFYGCKSLTTIPPIDTSKVTSMRGAFYDCSSLTTIPPIDTSQVPDVTNLFYGCTKLESLPLLDFSSVTTITVFFGYSNITTLTDLGGFTGLKINWTGSGSLKTLPNLTKQSLLNVFNTIADVNDLGGRKLEIGTTNLNKLTDEEKMIATSKGWTLS